MKRDSWIVEPGIFHTKTGFCYFCKKPVGAEHGPDCPYRKETVVARITFEYLLVMSEANTEFFVENNCASNVLTILNDMEERRGNGKCLCPFEQGSEYMREATEEDHKRFGFEWKHEI